MQNQTNNYPSLLEAIKYWLKLWFISFGGPAGQISMMHSELVDKKRWISEHRFIHALNYCMLLPGPEAIQLAIYIWWLLHWILGWIIAWFLFFLPSFFILVWLSWIYVLYGKLSIIMSILWWVKPAVVAIVLFAAYRIWSKTLKNNILIWIALLSFIAIFVFKISFPYIVFGAWIIWYIWWKISPDKFKAWWHHSENKDKKHEISIIDDDTPSPSWTKFSLSRILIITLIWVSIWIVALWFLSYFYGFNWVFTQMWIFFTKAALLTFGWAYAVLPYIYDWAVNNFWWLTWPQMIDWLALWETTPGPLIMIVTYVWFLWWWFKQIFWWNVQLLSWFIWALIATFFTFLPSFLFILIWWPIVEATRNDIKFTSPLTWITSAVVWVILNLALFFAWHTFFPNWTNEVPFNWQFDYLAFIITIISLISLIKYKIDIMKVIWVCALIWLVTVF